VAEATNVVPANVEAGPNGVESVVVAQPRRTTRKPKADKPEASRSMPEAIGQAPKPRTKKPKEVTE
jgi:hypothetical protein